MNKKDFYIPKEDLQRHIFNNGRAKMQKDNCLTDLINSKLLVLDSSITDQTLDSMYIKYKNHKNVFLAYVEVSILTDLMKKDTLRYEKYNLKFIKLSIELYGKLEDFKFGNME